MTSYVSAVVNCVTFGKLLMVVSWSKLSKCEYINPQYSKL